MSWVLQCTQHRSGQTAHGTELRGTFTAWAPTLVYSYQELGLVKFAGGGKFAGEKQEAQSFIECLAPPIFNGLGELGKAFEIRLQPGTIPYSSNVPDVHCCPSACSEG